MDFLPDAGADHLQIPDLGGPDYDNQGFNGYPTRQGWDVDKLRKGDIVGARSEWDEYSRVILQDCPPEELPESGEDLIKAVTGPFVQTWLFFGLFHEVLGRPVLRSECSHAITDAGGSTTRVLSAKRLFAEFVTRKEQIKSDAVWSQRFSGCLREAAWILRDLDSLHEELGGFVISGIAHLGLSVLVRTLDDYSVIWCEPRIRPANASIGRSRWFEQQLVGAGWCPNMVKRLETDLGIEGLYYGSLLSQEADDRPHTSCTKDACTAYNIGKDEAYVVQHSRLFCNCKDDTCLHRGGSCHCPKPKDIASVTQAISACVQKGEIPLLSVLKRDSGLEIRIVPFEKGTQYVAISHVWSDGMGNPQHNSLPVCQVQALDFYVSKLPGFSESAYFWIDTFCVPLTPRSARVAAIASLPQVYVGANHVLVLSRELFSVPLPKTPDEALVRIFRSKWMTRLWTLHEGALAAAVAFQFSDHAVRYDYLEDLIIAANIHVTDVSRLVGGRANISLSNITSIRALRESGPEGTGDRKGLLPSFWSSLRYRSTSRISDMAICGAILTGVDVRRVTSAADDHKKMESFWSCQQQVPSGILWVNGPRMTQDSLRWAPASLLDPRTWALSLSQYGPWARPTSDGLCFQGIEAHRLIGTPSLSQPGSVIEFAGVHTRQTYYVSQMENVGNATWEELADSWTACIALLWEEPPSPDKFTAGALVSCNDCSTGTGFASGRWLAQVAVFVKGGEWDHLKLEYASGFTDGVLDRSTFPVVRPSRVEHVPLEQEWCIF